MLKSDLKTAYDKAISENRDLKERIESALELIDLAGEARKESNRDALLMLAQETLL